MLGAIVLPIWTLSRYEVLWGFLFSILSIRTGVIIHRLFAHPLASVPGPRLAAATSLYLRYHDIAEHGGLTKHLSHLHKVFGKVLRLELPSSPANSTWLWLPQNPTSSASHPTMSMSTIPIYIKGRQDCRTGPNGANDHRALASKPVFRKCGDFYGSAEGIHTIITTDDPLRHRAMRNSASPLFSVREMDRSFSIGRSQVKRAVDSMIKSSEPVDLMSYFQALMVSSRPGLRLVKVYLTECSNQTNIVAESILGSKDLVGYDAPDSGWMATHHFLNGYRWLRKYDTMHERHKERLIISSSTLICIM